MGHALRRGAAPDTHQCVVIGVVPERRQPACPTLDIGDDEARPPSEVMPSIACIDHVELLNERFETDRSDGGRVGDRTHGRWRRSYTQLSGCWRTSGPFLRIDFLANGASPFETWRRWSRQFNSAASADIVQSARGLAAEETVPGIRGIVRVASMPGAAYRAPARRGKAQAGVRRDVSASKGSMRRVEPERPQLRPTGLADTARHHGLNCPASRAWTTLEAELPHVGAEP